ncbi:hypothetical protein B4144_1265 [Bacillus atrophaeus]|nr:hypothetical protein B4144_1265 [Bacillus atrophaeus]
MAEKHITSKYKELAEKHGVLGNTIKSIAGKRKKGAPILTYTQKLLDSSK